MKVKLIHVTAIKKNETEKYYLADLQFQEGDLILNGDQFESNSNPNIGFKIKHAIIGQADFENRVFLFAIEDIKFTHSIEDLLNKEFIKTK